jgi:acyl-CoA reductase-like NAD-dependent aldehyde dehydrogenase
MDTYPIYCAGKFIETSRIHEVVNPFTGKVFARTWLAGDNELDAAIKSALSSLVIMKEMPAYHRFAILSRIKEGLIEQRQEFAELICQESGKPIRYALGEVDRSIQSFLVAAEESKRLPREYMGIDWTPAGKGKEGLVKYFPIGVVAGISPFNFPLNLAVHKIAPAIAAGCPIILKPSSTTPLSTLKLARLIAGTSLPEGAVSILPMDRATGNRLVTDERINLLSFTGSPVVGWEMKRQAGRKKVVLELGGNAGVIISKGTNLEEAVTKCVTGSFSYSGQVCIHTQRIYIVKELFDDFAGRFVKLAAQLKQGSPLDPETEISAMIDEPNAKRVEEWVAEAVAGGAKILLGGQRSGSFFEPTILTATQPGMRVCCEEIFGPVVVIEPVDSLTEAVSRINESRFGLQAGVFTDSIGEMNYAFNHLEVGGVILNDVPTFRVDHMPYGGIKDSGLGREGIRYAIFDMLEPRLLVKNC